MLLFVPVPVILLLCLVEALGLSHYVGDRFYDLFLRVERPPRVAQELLLVDIDDRAIATVGAWPWSRDLIAEGLLLMKEMDAACDQLVVRANEAGGKDNISVILLAEE